MRKPFHILMFVNYLNLRFNININIKLMEYLIVHNESMAKFFGTEKFQKFILKIFDRCKVCNSNFNSYLF